jgi:nitroreductase
MVIEAILKRRSIRKYLDDEVPPDHIKDIIEAPMYAPTAWGKRPWHFIIVRKKRLREKLAEATPTAIQAGRAPVVIVVVADMELAKRWIEDLSIAAVYIMLEATELGYGTCFMQIRGAKNKDRDVQEYVKSVLKIPEGFNVECMISLGKSAEEKLPHSKKEVDKARFHWDGW